MEKNKLKKLITKIFVKHKLSKKHAYNNMYYRGKVVPYMAEYATLWCNGKTLQETMMNSSGKLDEGNFIKSMLKLYNMVEELKTVYSLLQHKNEFGIRFSGTAACAKRLRYIHLTYLGTGCIFDYDETHPFGQEVNGFKESDVPNYFDSSYSVVKGFTDRIMHMFENKADLKNNFQPNSDWV